MLGSPGFPSSNGNKSPGVKVRIVVVFNMESKVFVLFPGCKAARSTHGCSITRSQE